MIICKSALSLMEPYLDGELDASQKAELEAHLNQCPSCPAIYRRLSELGADLRTLAPRYAAPEHLQRRVLSAVRKEARVSQSWRFRPSMAWALAATVLLAVSAGWNVKLMESQKNTTRNTTETTAQEIVSSHVRSLIGAHLLDVPSTEQHTVKPWFNGKLDYAPDVKDFAAAGFPLIGGRVDYIDHRPVAALVYKRREHVINLFVWPSNSPLAAPAAVNGFNLVAWNQAGMNYCAISDLNQAELRQFVGLYH
ncbi:MAG: anti-sigma factor [Bryobacteraceae bacterium]|jgi:anti-sigma factor RsiW